MLMFGGTLIQVFQNTLIDTSIIRWFICSYSTI